MPGPPLGPCVSTRDALGAGAQQAAGDGLVRRPVHLEQAADVAAEVPRVGERPVDTRRADLEDVGGGTHLVGVVEGGADRAGGVGHLVEGQGRHRAGVVGQPEPGQVAVDRDAHQAPLARRGHRDVLDQQTQVGKRLLGQVVDPATVVLAAQLRPAFPALLECGARKPARDGRAAPLYRRATPVHVPVRRAARPACPERPPCHDLAHARGGGVCRRRRRHAGRAARCSRRPGWAPPAR